MELRQLSVFGASAAVALFTFTATAIPTGQAANPYQKIPERNIFGLKEPPPVQVTKNEPAPVLPKLSLTGITTILGNKLVFLTVQNPAKQGQPAKEEPVTLAEGQRDGAIELLSVDEVRKTVRVNNSGTEMTLDFDKNGAKPSAKTAAAAGPGVAWAPGMASAPGTPNPSQTNPGVIAGTPAVPAPTFPSQPGTLRRTLRLPNAANVPATTVAPPPSNAALGVPGAAAQQQAAGTATQITPGQIAPQ